MFVKTSLRDRLICFADSVGMTLLALLFLQPPVLLRLPSPNCFLKVYHPTLFAAVLIFFPPVTTSAISGTANSNKSAPTCFAAGTIYLHKNGFAVLQNGITCAGAPNPGPHCRPAPL